MAKYKLLAEEQETTINYSRADSYAAVVTHNRPLINKLRKLGAKELWIDDYFTPSCIAFEIPVSWVKIGKPRTAKKQNLASVDSADDDS